jgi:hypothetical protein
MGMNIGQNHAKAEVEDLNELLTKHSELTAFKERLESLEAHLEAALARNESLDTANALLRAEAMRSHNNAAFYELILRRVQDHEILQPIWDEFLVALKLVCPGIEDDFAAINFGTQRW